jgi:protein-tyrosine phosphatase
MVRVLFVCLGNICRSPTAEGVFRRLVTDSGLAHAIECDSAGTHAYHVGEGADVRSAHAAMRRGYDLSPHRARRVRDTDFEEFDFILAMDRDNLRHLEGWKRSSVSPAPGGADSPPREPTVKLFLDFAPTAALREVPDPYARGDEGFEQVLDLVESACEGLLEHIRTNRL